MASYRTLGRLSALAEDQWGLVTRRQAELSGVSPATLQRLASATVIERVAHGIYHLAGAPVPDHLDLRAAWLQLAPETPAWRRTPEQGIVSHRSATALYGIGHLPADRHEFTLPVRRQSRRPDVRLHRRPLESLRWITLRGLPTTRPSCIAPDLLADREDPEAVAIVVADAIREAYDSPGTFADTLAPYAERYGLERGDGIALLGWLLALVGDPEAERWMDEARAQAESRELADRRWVLEARRRELTPPAPIDESEFERIREHLAVSLERIRGFIESADESSFALLRRSADARIAASAERAEIRGTVPLTDQSDECFATTARTSASRRARSGRRRWGGSRRGCSGTSSRWRRGRRRRR